MFFIWVATTVPTLDIHNTLSSSQHRLFSFSIHSLLLKPTETRRRGGDARLRLRAHRFLLLSQWEIDLRLLFWHFTRLSHGWGGKNENRKAVKNGTEGKDLQPPLGWGKGSCHATGQRRISLTRYPRQNSSALSAIEKLLHGQRAIAIYSEHRRVLWTKMGVRSRQFDWKGGIETIGLLGVAKMRVAMWAFRFCPFILIHPFVTRLRRSRTVMKCKPH